MSKVDKNVVLIPRSMTFTPPSYDEHKGTVRVSGGSPPSETGKWVVRLLKDGVYPVDLSYLGGNAGHQAAKVCTFVSTVVYKDLGLILTWMPVIVKVKVDADQDTDDCYASIWRSVLHGDVTMLKRLHG